MYTINKAKQNIVNKINRALDKKIAQETDLVLPPSPDMGDFSFPCFSLSKQMKKSPAEIAKELASKIKPCATVKSIEAVGPYVNFILQPKKLVEGVLDETAQKDYGAHKTAKTKTMVEFAHPNTHKSFHIGHLRNIITGEAICRILANAGQKVVRANYQGDVGLHIAKCIWGITKLKKEFEIAGKKKDVDARVDFLAKAYVRGSGSFEKSKAVQAEIVEINKRIYDNDASIKKIYKETRKWSLDYLDKIYKRVSTKFDRFYFESEVFADGKKIALDGVEKGIFKTSDGAIIFEGDKHGLHNRVFINSAGVPTYEAKDMALAKLQFKEYSPDKIIHVVGKEQTEYFKVIIKALEHVLPKSKGKEEHLEYGWVRLKRGKMSSRLGNVVLGERLLDEVKAEIKKITAKSGGVKNKDELSEKITLAAVKYSFLKNGIIRDIAFDIKESINLSGSSGPYLLYTYARIQSILKKSKVHPAAAQDGVKSPKSKVANFGNILEQEKQLIFKIGLFPEITKEAAEKLDPSVIAKHLFELAREFNDYYHQTPVLKAKEGEKKFRLTLISSVAKVIDTGCGLLGFEVVESM